MLPRILIIGGGFSGGAVAKLAREQGFPVTVTTRSDAGEGAIPFAQAGQALDAATHLLVTAPPTQGIDPFLAAHGQALPGALRWVGYLSTTGVYGDRGGAWVDETTTPNPGQARSRSRVAAEEAWRAACARCALPLDIMRTAGIYGPGRSALDDLRAGKARRLFREGQLFGRIHVEDIARAVLAAMAAPPAGVRVLHLADDEPAGPADVVAYAAGLLGVEPPPVIPYEQAEPTMTEMGRSFWRENRRVSNAATKQALGIAWRHPTYREGLATILRDGG
ncbi:SDR family NAD(P)-dependent oxidoreductase [Rhodovarius crocodyli]|uniref:SDR family NAD(P)-dependent oxidoreductase n=1 Tax=Rhodovarius crocodyli TaxID=1979269 RepID=A0A437ME42_9PROT|nr:NAD-dependent epimerase/dehydratase family protein [Rhodovarius crocodyli]RVT95875.1 SDR family NAD(P)-dependent oxidoreductase [Rhodovarius crocodyli]